MTYPLVQFVRRPEVGAVVRFDFNAAGEWATDSTWFHHDGFSVGTPQLAGDPDGIGVEYGLRSLAFNLVAGGTQAEVAPLMTTLSRELLRQTNWLLFQLSPTSAPVWFKTYRSQPGDLSLDEVYVEGASRWGIAVNLVADAWAYGERVTLPSTVLDTNPTLDPATTHPMVHQLPPIKGDAPTPLHIRTGAPRNEKQLLTAIAMEPGVLADSYNRPLFVRGWNHLSADTTYTTGLSANALISGDAHVITFATSAAMVSRMRTSATSNVPALCDANGNNFDLLTAGRWRMFLRVRCPPGGTTTTFQMRIGTPATNVALSSAAADWRFGPTVTHVQPNTGDTFAPYLDMGEVSFPAGAALDGYYADNFQVLEKHLNIEVARISGTGTLEVDELLMVPIEVALPGTVSSTMAFVDKGTTVNDSGNYMHLDGEQDRIAITSTYFGTELRVVPFVTPPVVRGSLPWVHPGCTNLLHFIPYLLASKIGNPGPQPWDVSYQPRYLYLAGT